MTRNQSDLVKTAKERFGTLAMQVLRYDRILNFESAALEVIPLISNPESVWSLKRFFIQQNIRRSIPPQSHFEK
jgi:hypothetical protein